MALLVVVTSVLLVALGNVKIAVGQTWYYCENPPCDDPNNVFFCNYGTFSGYWHIDAVSCLGTVELSNVKLG